MDRLPAREIAPQAGRMVVHVVIGLVKARPRADYALSKEEIT
jgi:hypothetical protein